MALVVGTNSGFVTVAPTVDPADSTISIASRAMAMKDTSPSENAIITEIGWWCDNATAEANFEVGIYTHNIGDDEPEILLAGSSRTNAKGTGAGWKVVSGLNIEVSSETIYWITVQLDGSGTQTNQRSNGGDARCYKSSQSTLPEPFGTPNSNLNNFQVAIYAVVEGAAAGTNIQINIGDIWKSVDALKINIGDVWKDVVAVKLNISDTWKDVF